MNIRTLIELNAGGTSEGAVHGWDTRRGAAPWNTKTPTKQYWLDQNGHYLPERTELHDALVRKYQNKPTQQNPQMTVMLGGSASGKSTYTNQEAAKLRNPSVIDIDAIRSDLPEFQKVAGTTSAELLHPEASDIRDQTLVSALAHNNDIALEAVGHPDTPQKIDAIEKNGYKVNVVYVHRPVGESLQLANKRAEDSTSQSGRIKPAEQTVRDNHALSRTDLAQMMKPGRDVKIYDGTGVWDKSKQYPLIYHRGADGTVDVKNDAALERMQNSEEPKIPNVF